MTQTPQDNKGQREGGGGAPAASLDGFGFMGRMLRPWVCDEGGWGGEGRRGKCVYVLLYVVSTYYSSKFVGHLLWARPCAEQVPHSVSSRTDKTHMREVRQTAGCYGGGRIGCGSCRCSQRNGRPVPFHFPCPLPGQTLPINLNTPAKPGPHFRILNTALQGATID